MKEKKPTSEDTPPGMSIIVRSGGQFIIDPESDPKPETGCESSREPEGRSRRCSHVKP